MRSYYELPAEDQTELNLGLIKGQNLNQVLSLNLPSSFVFKMGSHSNCALGINKGDFVVVRRDIIPESGQSAYALLSTSNGNVGVVGGSDQVEELIERSKPEHYVKALNAL